MLHLIEETELKTLVKLVNNECTNSIRLYVTLLKVVNKTTYYSYWSDKMTVTTKK